MSVQQIKNYLTLVRFPNLFTLPSNILAGYFSSNTYSQIEINTIILVILSSTCLYAAGVIFNDVADRKIDQKERPNRPIPSGKITQRNAMILALLLMAISITVSYLISAVTLIVVFILISTIMLYDFVLKNSLFGPAVMGATRVLNILLGASPNLSILIVGQFDDGLYRLCLVCFSEFVYIAGISALSRYETHKNSTFHLRWFHTMSFLLPLSIGVYTASVGLFNGNSWIYLFIFGSFIFSMLRFATSSKPMANSLVQKIIGLLIVGIIVHDTVYIGGSLDSWYLGLGTYVFLIPTLLLSKKFYVT
jgi:UbiA prenyltransferase family protein